MGNKYIDLYVKYVFQNPDREDEVVFDYLLNRDVPGNIAFDIVNFTPIAFCRKYFEGVGVRFLDNYYVHENEDVREERFSENEIFNESLDFYISYIANQISKSDLVKILSRSSDFNAIVKALEDNADYKNLIMYPMRFYY